MAINITGNVTLLKNTAVDSSGVAIAPTSLEYGQIAINYNAKDPCIFIKVLGDNGATSIQKFVGEAVIAKTLSDILGESAADLATLKDLIKQFEGSSSDVLTLVKNLTTEVGNKANTSDLNAHKNNTSNPHSVTKAQVGLANVDNTSDAAKPISTATQNALNGKLGKTETAADSGKLGGRAATDYWHKANSNLKTVDWDCKALTADGFVKCSKGIGVNANERLSLNANAIGFQWGIRELSSNGFMYFDAKDGANDWVAKAYFDLKGELFVAGDKTVWHAGNSNIASINWTMQDANVSRTINQTCDTTRWLWLIKKSDDSGYRGIKSDGKDLSFWTNGANRLTIHETGNVYAPVDIATKKYIAEHNTNGVNEAICIKNNITSSAGGSEYTIGSDINFRGYQDTIYAAIKVRHNAYFGTRNMTLACAGGINFEHVATAKDNLYANGFIRNTKKVYIEELLKLPNKEVYLADCGQFAIEAHNNAMCIGVDGSENTRKGWLQVGHQSWAYSNVYGRLVLNPMGGAVGVNTVSPTDGYNFDVNGSTLIRGNLVAGSKMINTNKGDAFLSNNSVMERIQMHGGVLESWSGGNSNIAIRANSYDNGAGQHLIRNAGIVPSGIIVNESGVAMYTYPSGAAGSVVAAATGIARLKSDGNFEITKNLIVKGEAVTYSQDGVEARTVAAASATRLADLEDVDLTGASDNFVLYRSNTTNANGDRVWKARSDAKSWGEITGKPTTFTPVDHNHIGGTYTTPSDRGLKTNVLPLENGLNTILSINPVSYNWTSEAMDKYHFTHHNSIGVIAQELEDIIPTAVMQMDDQYKSVDYVQIIPYLVGAVKQLNSELANKNIAIENARKDYKRAYGESVNLKKEMDALKLEVDEMKSLIKQNLI